MTRTLATAVAVLALATTSPTASATTSGLVGHWPLNDGAGTTAADSSGFGASGILSGGVSWVLGAHGTALQFDGGTGRVAIRDSPQLEPNGAVTVSAWIARQGSPGDYRYIVSKGATGCIAGSYGLYSGPGGGLQFYVSRDHGTRYTRSPDAGHRVWDGNWHFVVGTYDGSTIRLFVDGAEIGSGTSDPGALDYQLTTSNDLYIGDYPGCQRLNFLGDIADVQIWNRPLGSDEIFAMAQPPKRPVLPAPPLNPPPLNPLAGSPIVSPTTVGNGPSSSNRPILSGLTLRRTNFTTVGIETLTIVYRDRHAGPVVLTVMSLQSSRCVDHLRIHRHCSRYVRIGGFRHTDRAGLNTVRLPSRLHNLRPGHYRVVVTAPSARAAYSIAVAFRIVP